MKLKKRKAGKIKRSVIISKKAKKISKKSRKFFIAGKAKVVASRKTKKKLQEKFIAKSFFKAKIKVIGIGGGGGSIVSEIGRSLHKASFLIADTDVRAFKKRRGIKYFLFGQSLTHGLGTGLNTQLATLAAESEKEKITKLFKGQDIVIFIASLGGGLGSAATQVFAKVAKDFGGIALGIFTLPFKFEGKNKYKIATSALNELRKSLNVSITIPNERIFKIIDSNTAITDAFSIVNKNLIESLESLIDLIYSPGIINIDFADLKVILGGRGNLAFLNTAEASGHDRTEKVVQSILNNPLYQSHNFKTEKVLFNIAGGSNLSMLEVDKISRVIFEQCPKAKIIFGISREPQLKNKIKTTLLMTGPYINGRGQMAIGEERVVKNKDNKKARKYSKISGRKNRRKKDNLSSGNLQKNTEVPFENALLPIFAHTPVEAGIRRLSIVEEQANHKKAIRRSALDVKKAEELEENKKSQQEKEWEIPAFLRKVKFKP